MSCVGRILLCAIAFIVIPRMLNGESPSVQKIVAEFERMASRDLWPGFEPLTIPLAIFDGQNSWLVGHPSPPEPFRRVDDRLWMMKGRFEAIRANTSVELGGQVTATMLIEESRSTEAAPLASTAIHETFHVHQKRQEWPGANEVDLFVYPFEDVEVLALRRLETMALNSALKERENATAEVKLFLRLRSQRFERLPETAVVYERRAEVIEGLATYVQRRAHSSRPTPTEIIEVHSPDGVRERAYQTGEALALLLQRFDPSWDDRFADDPSQSLDEMLAAVLDESPVEAAELNPAVETEARQRARGDVESYAKALRVQVNAFEGLTGWSIVVLARDDDWLWPQRFDPKNLSVVTEGQVLHRRMLVLGNSNAKLEMMGAQGLTVPAGEHPLFNGVKRFEVRGIAAEPSLHADGPRVEIRADGLKLDAANAELERTGDEIVVRLR